MIHKEEIVSLLRALYEASGFRLSLHDAAAREIAAYPEGHSRFCATIHTTLGGAAACRLCDESAFARARVERKMVIYRCHRGLYEAVSPIYGDDTLIGFLMMGQVLGDGADERERAREALIKDGVSPAAAAAATAEIPTCSRVQIEAFGKIMTACAGYLALSDLLRANGESPAEAAHAYMENHYGERLTIDTLCHRFHCCRATLTATYKRRYGETVTAALNRIRLHHARERLAAGLSVTETAAACGFSDASYLSKCFHRAFGYAPSEEKEKRQEK